MKKIWIRPQMITIMRGQSEENLLTACKIAGNSGPNDNDGICLIDLGSCVDCQIQTPS